MATQKNQKSNTILEDLKKLKEHAKSSRTSSEITKQSSSDKSIPQITSEGEKENAPNSLTASTIQVQQLFKGLKIEFNKTLVEINISDLKRPVYHKRKPIENRIVSIYNSFNTYGFLGGIFVSETTLNVIDGWYRSQIWNQLDHSTVPCYKINCTDNQERELHLRLNMQMASFDLSDFGIHFEGFNLLEDFGFSEQDLMPTENFIEEKKVLPKKETPLGFKKLSTTIKKDAYDKLIAFKEEKKLHHIADAIELLIERI